MYHSANFLGTSERRLHYRDGEWPPETGSHPQLQPRASPSHCWPSRRGLPSAASTSWIPGRCLHGSCLWRAGPDTGVREGAQRGERQGIGRVPPGPRPKEPHSPARPCHGETRGTGKTLILSGLFVQLEMEDLLQGLTGSRRIHAARSGEMQEKGVGPVAG